MTTPPTDAPATSIAEIVDLYERFGVQHYDEDLSQIDHALQTAALAVRAGAADPLVAAALLHDVGHLLELARRTEGHLAPELEVDLAHEASGPRYLARMFPPTVTAPIALHVRAKRYRVAVDVEYHAGLSAGSRHSLVLQGGPMTVAECAGFEANAGFAEAVLLREWDDRGKVDGLVVQPFAHYRPLLEAMSHPTRT